VLARPEFGISAEFSVWINLPWLVVLACFISVALGVHFADLVPITPPLLEAMACTAALVLATNTVGIFLCTRLCHLTDHLRIAGSSLVLVQLGLSFSEGLEGSFHLPTGGYPTGHAVPCRRRWRWCRRWRRRFLHHFWLAKVRP